MLDRFRSIGPIRPFAPDVSPPIARWEWWLLLILSLICVSFWLLHYHAFILPSSDFPSFERVAQSLWQGELPLSFKRMPLFPAIIGAIAKFLPMDRPLLHAALILNLFLSSGILVLVFLLCRRMIGSLAFVPVLAVMLIPEFHRMALQPLVDPMLTFFILLALFLFARHSLWQYLAVALAALSRYEASALIAIFFFLNVYRGGQVWLHLGLACLASLGMIGWLGLSVMQHDGGNPYLSQMSSQSFELAWGMAGTMLRSFYDLKMFDIIFAPLVVGGMFVCFRRYGVLGVAVVCFGLIYLAAHIAFGVDKGVYSHPVLWMPPLFVVIALRSLAQPAFAIGETLKQYPRTTTAVLFALLLIVLQFWFEHLLELSREEGLKWSGFYSLYYVAVLIAIFYFVLKTIRKASLIGCTSALLIACIFSSLGAISFRDTVEAINKTYYSKYVEYLAMNWLDENMQPHERALVFGTTALSVTKLQRNQFVTFPDLEAETHEDMVNEMRRGDISYLVYWYRRDSFGMPGDRNYARNLYYYKRYKVYLAKSFKNGEDVPGFQHLETLEPSQDAPIPIGKKVQIYRLLTD